MTLCEYLDATTFAMTTQVLNIRDFPFPTIWVFVSVCWMIALEQVGLVDLLDCDDTSYVGLLFEVNESHERKSHNAGYSVFVS